MSQEGESLMTTQEASRERKGAEASKRITGKMTVEEAGRRGGEKTAETRGHEFYQAIGRKGGEVVSRDKQHMSAIGRKGGEAVSRDRAHMASIGQKGGEARSRHFKQQQLDKKKASEAGEVTVPTPSGAPSSSAESAHGYSKAGGEQQEKAG
jgi:general stress protein YciG